MKKNTLLRQYPGLPKKFIFDTINFIISVNREMPIDKAKFVKTISPKEFKFFVEVVGSPIEKDMDKNEHSPTKAYLVEKYYNISERTVLAEINEIIKEYRQYNDTPVYDKFLTPKEYEIFKDRFE